MYLDVFDTQSRSLSLAPCRMKSNPLQEEHVSHYLENVSRSFLWGRNIASLMLGHQSKKWLHFSHASRLQDDLMLIYNHHDIRDVQSLWFDELQRWLMKRNWLYCYLVLETKLRFKWWSIHNQMALVFLPPANEVCEGNVFTGVCLSTGSGVHPPMTRGRHPPEQTPPSGQTPPPPGYYGMQSTSGQYSSYWNAFLLVSTYVVCERLSVMYKQARLPEIFDQILKNTPALEFGSRTPPPPPTPIEI